MDLVKKCPHCGREQKYKSIITYERAVKANTLCHSCSSIGRYRKNNVSILLNEEFETYYWIGFILADGCIKNNNRLFVSLAIKDIEHLKKLGDYISVEVKNRERYCSISAMNIVDIPELVKKFDIKHDKTYNPPDIKLIKEIEHDKMLSLIIGFIDGDGSIKNVWKRKDFTIAIKNHSTWLEILNYFSEVVTGKKLAKINARGYASLCLTRCSDIIKLKKFAIEKNLPILNRKWDIIKCDYINKTMISEKRIKDVTKLVNENKSIKEISSILNIPYTSVYMIIRRNNLKTNE